MNDWGRGWLLIAVPAALFSCGNATDGRPSEPGGAGASGASAGRGGAASGGLGSGGGSTASGGSGTSGATASAGKGGSDALQAGASGTGAGGVSTGGVGAGGARAGGGGLGGSGVGGRAGAGGASHASDALMPAVNAFCAAARACCAAESMPTQLADCESSFALHDSTFAALERGTATFDQTGLAACVTAYQQAATKCQELPVQSACRGLIHGVHKEGEPCIDVTDCASTTGAPVACLVAGQNATEGKCAKVTHGKAGDSCLTSCKIDENCSVTSYGATDPSITFCFEQDGLFCSIDDGHCKAIAALGAACSYDGCGSANHCDTTCKKSSTLNQPCTQTCLSSLQCINNQCVSPSFTVGGTCSGQWFGPY